ncbi:hypothetical protein VZT92_013780 [Zoarces viviparus]|uniref:Uncharacterized protein n=1 Tax=Zoarces viviparus TaxID=48416 RepID=A0AAW1F4Y1_ZOAVI
MKNLKITRLSRPGSELAPPVKRRNENETRPAGSGSVPATGSPPAVSRAPEGGFDIQSAGQQEAFERDSERRWRPRSRVCF